ncbi:MAG TPA: hypothetical protein VNA87_04685, partial [Actinomycetota bacterium]|nr:hypothetical protein [Actinomycetota bacterium]
MTQREVNLKRRELAEDRSRTSSSQGLKLAGLPSPSSGVLGTPTAGQPSQVAWAGSVTYTPDNFLSSPFSGADPCDTDECQEYSLTVPAGTKSLYLEMSWDRPDFGIYLYAFDPDGAQFGIDDTDIDTLYDKRPGFSTTLPVSQASIPDPKAGVWRIRARAAWGLNIDYRASAVATASPLVEWTREDPRGLSKYATHKIPVNIVFAGIKPTKQEIERLREELPTQFRPSVSTWQTSDGGRDS